MSKTLTQLNKETFRPFLVNLIIFIRTFKVFSLGFSRSLFCFHIIIIL